MMSLFPKSIRVPVDAIKTASKQLAELSEQVQDYFDQLGNAADGMEASGDWVGDDAEVFIRVNAGNRKKYDRLIQDVSKLSEGLSQYAAVMEERDSDWAQRIKSIG